MLKNYFQIDENISVEHFMREVNEKKNSQYIILKSSPESFVDFRTVSLKLHEPNQKLKGFKKTIPQSFGKNKNKHLQMLIDSGERLIQTEEGIFDFISGLAYIQEEKPDFANETLHSFDKKEVYAINLNDKISTAKKLFVDKKVNLLPVIENLEVVGELRPRDFLVASLYKNKTSKGDIYDANLEENTLNLPISNLYNKKPHILSPNQTIGDAIDLMVNKSLPSIIVADQNGLHSVVSYKDIFNKFKFKEEGHRIEIIGSNVLKSDELIKIEEIAKKNLDKISRMSHYDSLKISFKEHGNEKSRKIGVKLLLSHGNDILHVKEEIGEGSTKNPVKLVQKSINSLGKRLKNTLNKK